MMTLNQPKTRDNSQLLQDILDQLTANNEEILSALVISDDGLKVASGLPHQDDDDLALTASDLVDTAQDFSKRLEHGRLNRVVLEGEQRTTVIVRASKRTVLAVSMPTQAKLGLITHAMRRAADQIATIFG